MTKNISKSLIVILLAIFLMALTGCEDAITANPANSSSANSKGGIDSNSNDSSDMTEEDFKKFKEELNKDRGWDDDDDDMPNGPYGGPVINDEHDYETNGPWRLPYLNGITHNDMIRYTDQHLYSIVFMERWEVTKIFEQDVYLLENRDLGQPRYLCIITDTASKTANPIVGDTVSIYGEFVDVDTITWPNGKSAAAPLIKVHRLYINNMNPPDLEDFTEGFVTMINGYEEPGHEVQYLSGTRIRALCNIEKSVGFNNTSDDLNGLTTGDEVRWHIIPYHDISYKYPRLSVDGYNIVFDKGITNGEEFDPMFLQYADDNDMFWTTMNIVGMDLSFDFATVRFEVESIEPAGKFIGDYIPAMEDDT